MGHRRQLLCGFAVWLAGAVLKHFAGARPSAEYQAFIDHFPITKCDIGPIYQLRFGPSRALRLPPSLLDRFDWLLELDDAAHKLPIQHSIHKRLGLTAANKVTVEDPHTIFATAFALPQILEAAEQGFYRGRSDRVLVLGGSDQLLSEAFGSSASGRAATARRLREFFAAVFYESVDVEVEGVRVMPRGLSEHYLRPASIGGAVAAVAAARLDEGAKPAQVLAAFDHFSSFMTEPEWWDTYVVKDASLSAKRSRRDASIFADSTSAREAGVEARSIDSKDWFVELSKYRFLLSPIGSGLVPPKMLEALLVLTVPIVQHMGFAAFSGLAEQGFPIAIVDAWANVTRERLGSWWAAHAPRLVAFRRRCLTAEGYWRMFTGGAARCG